MPSHPGSMSAIVPVFNEEAEIGTIVPAVQQVLEARGADWEIIVVDNASEDATVARLTPFLADDRIRLLRNQSNRGKGYSVRRGMLEARGELRLMCDADCAPSLGSLPDLEAAAEGAQVVAGLRNAPESRVSRYQPISRRAVSLAFIWLCRGVMAEPLRDIFCGFKLYTAAAAEDVFTRLRIEGWVFDAEALALARALGYRVSGCPIAWAHRSDSRLSIPRILIPALRELYQSRLYVSQARQAALRTGPVAPAASASSSGSVPRS